MDRIANNFGEEKRKRKCVNNLDSRVRKRKLNGKSKLKIKNEIEF